MVKIRPPSIQGVEEKRLYDELKEIKYLAPERSDIGHLKHLVQLKIEFEMVACQEHKCFIQKCENYLEEHEGELHEARKTTLQTQIHLRKRQLEEAKNRIKNY